MRQSFLLILLSIFAYQITTQQTQQQKKIRIQKEQLEIRDRVGLTYGENTETLTFAVNHMSDFVVKPTQNEQIKGTLHTYWREQNVYVSSQYRDGENMRVIIYEDSYRIVLDFKFYITYGFKFQAEKGKTYTLRFMDQGRISKLVAMELSKTSVALEDKANKEHLESFGRRLGNMIQQLKVLTGISQFAIVLHQKQSVEMNHSTCYYMTYLMIEGGIILIIVALQVKVMLKLLKSSSVV